MPKRKPFHNRLEELFLETRPDLPGPWEDLLTRVEPQPGPLLAEPETPLPPATGETGQEPESGEAAQKVTARKTAGRDFASEEQAGPPGWENPLTAVGQADPAESESRGSYTKMPQDRPPGWKNFLAAVEQAAKVWPKAGDSQASNPQPAPPGWKELLTAVQQAEQVETETMGEEAPASPAGPPIWKNFLQAVERAEQDGLGFWPEEVFRDWPRHQERPGGLSLGPPKEKGGVLSTSLFAGDDQLVSIELEGSPDRMWSEQEASLVNSIGQQMVLHLENLRLLEQAEQYRQEAEQVVQRMTRAGWEGYLKEQRFPLSGFVYDHGRVYSMEPDLEPGTGLDPGGRIVQAIKVREETIGQLVVEPPGESQPADLVRAIAERLGLQIESLRLLEETEQARQQLDRRAAELETVAQVSTAAANLLDPQALLQAVVDLTQSSFSLYHVQIYLLDEDTNQLILAAGSGKVGQAAIASQLSLPLYSDEAVAQVARNRSGLIIPDTRLQSGYEHYPFLPDTLSELAVPLIAGEEVIGAFSVLADIPNRFYIDDMRTFATLASQVAVALRNAELYAEQMETVERLRELDHLKSAFLANMSHELRTPLNSILGFAQVIMEGLDGPLTDDMVNDLELIEKNGRHLLNLINDVLDMAKIEAGRLSLDFETFDLRELIQDVLDTASPLARNRSVDLWFEAETAADLNLCADRFRIRQILLNLIGNAIKFTENGAVVVTARKQANLLRVGIQDSGIGIPPEKLETIFEAFSQVDTSTTRKAGGTGLGLPISRHLVEMHGGRLWAESRGIPGEGTTFWLELLADADQKSR